MTGMFTRPAINLRFRSISSKVINPTSAQPVNDTDADILWLFDVPIECGVYPHEIAETKVGQVHALAGERGYPLKATVEEA